MGAVLPRLQAIARPRTPTSPTRGSSARAGSTTNTAYHAFLVPTFETGRLAGLGLDPARRAARDRLGLGAVRRAAPSRAASPSTTAGTSAPAAAATSSTSCALLEPQPVDPRVGTRDMDVQDPARTSRHRDPALGGILRLGGALRVPDADLDERRAGRASTKYENWDAAVPAPVPAALAAFVNLADDYAAQTAAADANAATGRRPASTTIPTR